MLSNEEVRKKIGVVIPPVAHGMSENGSGWVLFCYPDLLSESNQFTLYKFTDWKLIKDWRSFFILKAGILEAVEIAQLIYKYGK